MTPPEHEVQRAELAATPRGITSRESCDVCGATSLEWRKCKLVCVSCRSIVKSCADL